MDHDENNDRRTSDGSDLAPGSARAKTWIVASNEEECDHPVEDLRRVGDDGSNAYYQCGRCDAVIVAQDELVRLTLASQERSDREDRVGT